MTRTVWKFAVPLTGVTDLLQIDMPVGAKVLSAVNQDEHLVLYALVDPKANRERRVFRVAGTGHPIESFVSSRAFVGTVLFARGKFVLHVFETE